MYILGNGFDINHGLKTQYSNYRDYLLNQNTDLLDRIEKFGFLRISNNIDMWSDLEQALSFDYMAYFKERMGLNSFSRLPGFDYFLQGTPVSTTIDEIQEELMFINEFTGIHFKNWLSHTYKQGAQFKEGLIEQDSCFVTFNYTSILEDVYKIEQERVCYIHGRLNNIDDSGLIRKANILTYKNGYPFYKDVNNNFLVRDNIQFGSLDNTADEVKQNILSAVSDKKIDNVFIDETISAIEEFCRFSYKSIFENIERLESFVNQVEIDKIVIMGHSIMGIDKEYYDKVLIPKYSNIPWCFYFHGNGNKQTINDFIEEFKIRQFTLIEW